MEITLLGLTPRTSKTESMIKKLEALGISIDNVSIIMKDVKDIPVTYFQQLTLIDDVVGTNEGLGTVSIPGVENVLIGGPIESWFGITGADYEYDSANSIIGAVAGGFVNALMDLGVDEEDAQKIQERIKLGDILVGVSIKDESKSEDVLAIYNKLSISYIAAITR